MEHLLIPLLLLIRFLLALIQENRRIQSDRQSQVLRRGEQRVFHPAEFELR